MNTQYKEFSKRLRKCFSKDKLYAVLYKRGTPNSPWKVLDYTTNHDEAINWSKDYSLSKIIEAKELIKYAPKSIDATEERIKELYDIYKVTI